MMNEIEKKIVHKIRNFIYLLCIWTVIECEEEGFIKVNVNRYMECSTGDMVGIRSGIKVSNMEQTVLKSIKYKNS